MQGLHGRLEGVKGAVLTPVLQVVPIKYVSCTDHTVAQEVRAKGGEVAVNTEGMVQGLARKGIQGLGVGGVSHQACRGVRLRQRRSHVDESAADAIGASAAFGKSAADLQEEGQVLGHCVYRQFCYESSRE